MLQIDNCNGIIIDGQQTGLALVQAAHGTVIYTPESKITRTAYREHAMPCARYSTTHKNAASGVAGCVQLRFDVLALLAKIASEVAA